MTYGDTQEIAISNSELSRIVSAGFENVGFKVEIDGNEDILAYDSEDEMYVDYSIDDCRLSLNKSVSRMEFESMVEGEHQFVLIGFVL